jgi:hypothetical protein
MAFKFGPPQEKVLPALVGVIMVVLLTILLTTVGYLVGYGFVKLFWS